MVISCRSGSAQGRKSKQLRTHEPTNDFRGCPKYTKSETQFKKPIKSPTASSTGERLDYAVKNKETLKTKRGVFPNTDDATNY